MNFSYKNTLNQSIKSLKVLTLSSLFLCAGESFAQTQQIKLPQQQITIKELFKQIEKQTQFSIGYNHSKVSQAIGKKVNVSNGSVESILTKALQGTGLTFSFNGNHIVITPQSSETNQKQEEKKQITGQVVDSKGEPVIGATVMEKGTTNGTITDFDGNFVLNATEGSSIEVSYIGYKTQMFTASANSIMTISLKEDTEMLDEVVVVGYGVVKKSDLTGSVSRVTTKELNNIPVSSIDKALQGRVAGVQISSISGAPGAGTSIRIRGGNSISADNEPLYVVDGFIGGGDLNSINPADIESIEILKDAASTSIYGSRGANGVIMITTKKGSQGSNKVNVSIYQGFQSLCRKLPFMEGPERAAFANDYADYTNTLRPFPDLSKVTHTDWQDLLTRTAPITNVDFSVSGGNETFQHYISGNFYNQEGVYKGSGFTRYQTRINLDKKLFSWLKLGTQINASYTNKDNPKFDYLNFIKEASTTSPVYNEDGSYNYIDKISGQTFENPVANVNLITNNTYKKRFLSNFYLELNPIKNLFIKSTLGVDFESSKTEQFNPGSLPVRAEQKRGGYARLDNGDYFSLLNENTVNYLLDIDRHRVSIMGGMTLQKEATTSSWSSIEGITNDHMEFHNMAAGDPATAKYGSDYYSVNMVSFLGRLNYSFNNRYLLTVTGRYDGSSRLAANNKWAFFPSFAAAWRLSEEDFIKNLSIFHNLKLRASYGKIGNQAIKPYQSLASLNVVSPTIGGNKTVGYILGNLANPDLKWETTSQFDLGLEAAFFDGRLSFELDYYYKRTKDLLMNVEIPWISGYKTQLQNIGEVQNQGIEFMLNANIITTKDWTWDLNMNVSSNRNKVLNINDAEYLDVAQGVRLYKNQPAGVFVGAVYEGTWKSQAEIDTNPDYMPGSRPGTAKFKDVNNNGKYDGVQDYAIIGNPEPKFFGGFGTNLRYKNLSMEMFFQGSYGNDILNNYAASIFFGNFGSNLYKFKDGQRPWSEENPTSDIPAAGSFGYNVNVNNMSYDVCVQDGSYLKLKTLRLAYNVPIRKLPWIKNLTVYALFNNLFTLTSYDWGYDPDVTGNGSVVRGVDNMVYPQNRSYQFGLNVEF